MMLLVSSTLHVYDDDDGDGDDDDDNDEESAISRHFWKRFCLEFFC